MCGIAGIISKSGTCPIEYCTKTLDTFKNTLAHRGPDASGSWMEKCFGVAHTRLSIVDRAFGAQPMFNNQSKDIGIVYNGEIYNYKELRDDLIGMGVKFSTASDTEVVLRMYEKFGTGSFSKLNGMFAFFIWDKPRGVQYLVRDYIGMKPVYYYEDSDKFIFASEIKAILALDDIDRTPDPLGVQDYLVFRYMHAPRTMFQSIRRLAAGHFLTIKGGSISSTKYWDVSYNYNPISGDLSELENRLLETLEDIVKSQLMGEVPVGVLLSGGVDSSAISYLIHKNNANLTTFNIGYPEVNEFPFSSFVADKFGLKHIEITTTVQELIDDFDKILWALDEPLADPACFPLYKLCQELKKHVTVVLSGEGGDEMFCGYPQYVSTFQPGAVGESIFNDFLRKSYYYLDIDNLLARGVDRSFLGRNKNYLHENSVINGMMGYDLKTWVPEDLMMKADKIMMANSLEGRFPFLDKRIIDFAHNIPDDIKLNGNATKWILKKALLPHLTDKIVHRQKMGFTVPVDLLLERMRKRVMDTFFSLDSSHFLSEILNIQNVRKMAADYYSRFNRPAMQIWTVFILLSWFDRIYRRT